jgi:prepilin-type N-terminal cleavage/methylation domain-containing protein
MKKGFTLVELLVSIAIFGLIAMLMFGTIDNLRKQLTFYQNKEAQIVHKNRILSLLRSDFDRPKTLKIIRSSENAYDTILIDGSNRSLYGMNDPYVVWMILKKTQSLVRLESSGPITLPIPPESLYQIHSDTIGNECEIFRVYDSNQSRLVYLKFFDNAPFVVQTSK